MCLPFSFLNLTVVFFFCIFLHEKCSTQNGSSILVSTMLKMPKIKSHFAHFTLKKIPIYKKNRNRNRNHRKHKEKRNILHTNENHLGSEIHDPCERPVG